MELPAPATPNSSLSSVLRLFRSLAGGKNSHQVPDQALVSGRGQEQDVIPLMGTEDASGPSREELVLQAKTSHSLHLPGPKGSHHQMDIAGLGMGDSGVQASSELQEEGIQGPEGKLALAVAGQDLPIDQLENEEEEVAGEASGDMRTVGRGHSAQAMCGENESLPMAMGSLVISPEAFTAEEEKECLLQKDLRLGSATAEGTPWNRLLNIYKQLRKPATAKVRGVVKGHRSERESLTRQENQEDVEVVEEEEGEKEEDSSFSLSVHGFATIQSPLHKTFKSTDTVGFVENELKKVLAVQRESRLWKTGGQEGRELLIYPEITLEEAGIVDGQHLLLEEMDEMGNWPPD
ncbi:gametogenetin-binding protein 1-like isoform X2 [Phascolarctos cinereus]|uniref:Gametogenetin-binding protein 1 n=1 Tax=Phascolarctos cinereus TaxID=38626 RepID=A0A6P5LH97_PHACI|nr:gametogenetin-binding protein 1-like isoform X2 [Phascolarctos cinereus]